MIDARAYWDEFEDPMSGDPICPFCHLDIVDLDALQKHFDTKHPTKTLAGLREDGTPLATTFVPADDPRACTPERLAAALMTGEKAPTLREVVANRPPTAGQTPLGRARSESFSAMLTADGGCNVRKGDKTLYLTCAEANLLLRKMLDCATVALVPD